MDNPVIKGLTLLLFISLITTFVAYKAGYFGQRNILSLDPNGSVINNNKVKEKDTLVVDSLKLDNKVKLIHSTKSGVIVDPVEIKIPDSTNSKRKKVMPGSKSGVIFEATEEESLEKKDTSTLRKRIMPGSKSGVIFEPEIKKKKKKRKKRKEQ